MERQGKIAFYAPLKSPDDPTPSGDREIARLMMKALRFAGYDVELMSQVISYQKRPTQELYEMRKATVSAEEARIRNLWNSDRSVIPDLWFTYHPYCKSPDWLGPSLCKAFGVPYVTAEACRTRQGVDGDWKEGRAAAQAAIRFAKVNFVLKESDWRYLSSLMPAMETAVRIKPFIDMADLPPVSRPASLFENDAPTVFSAGMMRPGAKMESYKVLAAALNQISDKKWNLVVAGEGPERTRVEDLLHHAGAARVKFTGSVEHEQMFALMDSSDIFAWPGIGEAIGLVYLEAQARGVPVVALQTAGVPLVVKDSVGGLLTEEDRPDVYAAAIGRLLDSPELREQLGTAGRHHVAEHHDLRTTAAIFRSHIDKIIAT
ncbi:MAG: glycosyltransferase family 4 protein [Pseudomonadota bacterium]